MENREKNIFGKLLKSREISLLLITIVVCAVFSVLNPTFVKTDNLLNIVKQITLVTILAVGQTFIITSGGIDLSVGYNMALCCIVMAVVLKAGAPTILGILVSLGIGTLIGFANGLMVTKLKLQPFIVTLGMANITKGLILVITQGFVISLKDPFIIALGQNSIGGVFPIMAIALPVVVIIGTFVMKRTLFGNYVKAIGGNETALRLSGVNTVKMKTLVYTLAGLLCGVAGVIITGRLNGGNPNAGANFDMDSVAAAVVGGTAMSGGSGTVVGTMLGAFLLGAMKNGLVLIGVDMYWQTVFIGAIIIVVCTIDAIGSARKNRS